MSGGGNHEVVGDTGRQRRLEKRVVRARAFLELLEGNRFVAEGVHVEVDAAIVVQDKVADGVGALDGEGIAVPVLDKPGVFGRDEVASRLVGPQLKEN